MSALDPNLHGVPYHPYQYSAPSSGNSFWSNLGSSALNAISGAATGGLSGLISAGISGIGKLFGIGGNGDAVKVAKQQLQLGQQQIQAQYDINQQNIDEAARAREWQESMFNKNNDYNSALSQKERFEAAGFNPYIMMGGQGATASSQPGSPSLPTIESPSQGYQMMADAMGNQFQNRLLTQQIRGAGSSAFMSEQQAVQLGLKNSAEIFQALQTTKNDSMRVLLEQAFKASQMSLNSQMGEVYLQQVQNMKKQVEQMDQEIFGNKLDNAFAAIRNKWQEPQILQSMDSLKAQISKIIAEVDLMAAQEHLTKQQALTEVSKRVLNFAEANTQRELINFYKSQEAVNDQTVTNMRTQDDLNNVEYMKQDWDWHNTYKEIKQVALDSAKESYELLEADNTHYFTRNYIAPILGSLPMALAVGYGKGSPSGGGYFKGPNGRTGFSLSR